MLLGKLFNSVSKRYRNINVRGISIDSRKLKKGYVFFAIQGNQVSGVDFINEALSKGASAIISDKHIKYKKSSVPLMLVHNIRKSLSEACSKFYKQKPKKIVCVTGTNGKTSVADFFYQILSINNIPAASIGTLGIVSKKYKKKTSLTSIDSISLNKNLEILSKNKINHVILEASSHGLEQKRLDGLNISNGIFTNFSHDHLDYHKNMKIYFNSKMYLFKNLLKKKSTIITDEDNKEFKILKKIADIKNLTTSTIGTTSGDIKVLYNKYIEDKQIIKISIKSKVFLLKIPLIGYFQIKNLLMAVLSVLSCTKLSQDRVFKQLHKIKPVPGRLESVANLKNNSNIIIDFAHTPDALEQSLLVLKKQFKKEIILVFGCGGQRDIKKRIIMGKIAKKYCRKIFVTDDNPRNEDPKKIRKNIIKGCKKYAVDIGNRKIAIKTAIKDLKANEILLVAGKGHEETQDYGKKIISFSDKKVIKSIIKKSELSFKKDYWSEKIAKKAFNNYKLKNINYNGVSINSKTVKKNNLFFAIKGKNNDGHKFAAKAIKNGAIKSVVTKKIKFLPKNRIIKVKNTLLSLNKLANVTRDSFSGTVIGITGSVGKTTLKNLVSFALNNFANVYQAPYSYNNKFGVPLSISNLKNNNNYGVFEIGMDKKGEIDNLSKIVKPNISVITNIAEAHFKNFNTLKDIAKAKSEIIKNTLNGGSIVLNKDSNYFNFLFNKAKKKGINIISFSSKRRADIYLTGIKKVKNYFQLKILVKNRYFNFNIPNSINSFINNILACISILSVLDVDLNSIKNKFLKFKPPEGRGDLKIINKFKRKFKFIDDSYNANPLSMRSAINNMKNHKRIGNSKKIVFLGDMLELGKKSKKLHKKLSIDINKSDIDKVFVYGRHIKETFNFLSTNKKGKIFNNLEEAYIHFSKIVHNNDLLMVKGSNATGLNQFSKNIKKGQISAL